MKRITLIVVTLLLINTAYAQNYKQYTIFIYSFTRYIQWPDDYTKGDFEIHVLGDCQIIEDLKLMAQSKKAGDRTIKIVKINSASEIKKCNILFIPTGKGDQLTEILSKVSTQSILVVTEEPGLGAKGSAVNFLTKEGKLVFEMNQSAMSKQNLKASNELTKLAIII